MVDEKNTKYLFLIEHEYGKSTRRLKKVNERSLLNDPLSESDFAPPVPPQREGP